MRKVFPILLFTLGAGLLAFQNCGVPHVSTNVEIDAKSFVVDGNKLTSLVNQDLSCSVDSDCEGLTYGSKACGGPSKAIVVSKHNPSYADILDLAHSITQQEQAFNQATGAVSTCSLLLAPTPHCLTNSCR